VEVHQKDRVFPCIAANKVIYAQIIDDLKGNTLASASSVELDKKGGVNLAISKSVGKKVAEKQ